MKIDPTAIGSIIKDEVLSFLLSAEVDESGHVLQIGDGIARVIGLNNAMNGELLIFESGATGLAMNLEEDNIAVAVLGDDTGIKEGDYVTRTGSVAQVPVGDALLGRVVNALGEEIDHQGQISTPYKRPVERVAPGVLARKSVDVPLLTGIKAIDAMVPIGRGQRQLIIGDRQTGKTAIALDAIINQKGKDVNCVYVAVGQKNSTVSSIVKTLSEHGSMEYTTIVVAGASESAPMQYLAPYSGCAMAEHWMEQGKDVLIVYDDLSKHVVAYRTMSLLMSRPPGREAYPGDAFYLHSRILERAGRLTEEYGGGSITALPIIETQGGDMSAYIPTNVISITDGQIYLETELFNSGIRPAINPGLSVSRVGGAAQVRAMKRIAGPLRTELAQYRELASFAQFSSDLDKGTRERLRHGEQIVEVFKQKQYKPIALENEILILFAITKQCLSDVYIENIAEFEEGLFTYFEMWHTALMSELKEKWEITTQMEDEILEGIERYKKTQMADQRKE